MDSHTLNAVRNVLQKEAGYRMPVNPLADAIHQKLAGRTEESNAVQQVRKSDNSGAKPSSNSSPGMEDKNDGYGKSDKKLDDDPSKDGAEETGKTLNASAGKHITTESEGMKDLSIKQHGSSKEASLAFLAQTSRMQDKAAILDTLRRTAG